MIFDEIYERVAILSLAGREERAARARRELLEKGLSRKAVVVRAVDGKAVGVPAWWRAQPGAWGCLLSHARLLEDAMMDGVERLLVVEDDCVWQRGAARLAAEFHEQVPGDWGQIYYGGQWRDHLPPRRMDGMPAVLRAASIHRTHAYAVEKGTMARMHAHILHAPDYIEHFRKTGKRRHVDHQLEVAHRRKDWRVYTPAFWLAGQGENASDIVNRVNPEQWWHWSWGDDYRRLPVVVTAGPLTAGQKQRLHFGKHLSEADATVDEGMRDAATGGRISACMDAIAREALGMQRLPACHPWPDQVAWLRSNWPGGVIDNLPGEAELAELCDFPASGLLPNPWWDVENREVMA